MSTNIKELEAQLAAAKNEERKKRQEREKAFAARWTEIMQNPSSFDWYVVTMARQEFHTGEKMEGVLVQRRVKSEIAEALAAEGNGSLRNEEKEFHGMFYYRTDENILTYEGGGWHVLKTPKLCSDEEWAAILAGDIPMKFRK